MSFARISISLKTIATKTRRNSQPYSSWSAHSSDYSISVDYHHAIQTRQAHPYLTEKRFPLNWAIAEMVKQYMRNKRRHAVKMGHMPDRKTRKRMRENNDNAQGSSKRRKTGTAVRHIDDEEEEQDEDNDGNQADPQAEETGMFCDGSVDDSFPDDITDG